MQANQATQGTAVGGQHYPDRESRSKSLWVKVDAACLHVIFHIVWVVVAIETLCRCDVSLHDVAFRDVTFDEAGHMHLRMSA